MLYETDYVLYDKANDQVVMFEDGTIVIFGDKEDALNDCRGNEYVVRCTDLPAHWQEAISIQIQNLK